MIADLIRYRRFVFMNAWTEMRHRYAGTAIGLLWHVVQPVGLILLFAFIFGSIIPMRGGGGTVDFLVYFSSGMLPWLAFSEAVTSCTMSLVNNAHYLRKLAVPEVLFVARTAVISAMMMLVTLALVMAAALLSGSQPTIWWLTVPVAGLLMIGFGFGIGLILSPIHVFARDTGQAMILIMQFWMWLSPVILTLEAMPQGLRASQAYNPGAWFLEGIRDPLLTGQPAPWTTWLLMIASVVLTVWLGNRAVNRVRSGIRDTI